MHDTCNVNQSVSFYRRTSRHKDALMIQRMWSFMVCRKWVQNKQTQMSACSVKSNSVFQRINVSFIQKPEWSINVTSPVLLLSCHSYMSSIILCLVLYVLGVHTFMFSKQYWWWTTEYVLYNSLDINLDSILPLCNPVLGFTKRCRYSGCEATNIK